MPGKFVGRLPRNVIYPNGKTEQDCDHYCRKETKRSTRIYKPGECMHPKAKRRNKGKCIGGVVDCTYWEITPK